MPGGRIADGAALRRFAVTQKGSPRLKQVVQRLKDRTNTVDQGSLELRRPRYFEDFFGTMSTTCFWLRFPFRAVADFFRKKEHRRRKEKQQQKKHFPMMILLFIL